MSRDKHQSTKGEREGRVKPLTRRLLLRARGPGRRWGGAAALGSGRGRAADASGTQGEDGGVVSVTRFAQFGSLGRGGANVQSEVLPGAGVPILAPPGPVRLPPQVGLHDGRNWRTPPEDVAQHRRLPRVRHRGRGERCCTCTDLFWTSGESHCQTLEDVQFTPRQQRRAQDERAKQTPLTPPTHLRPVRGGETSGVYVVRCLLLSKWCRHGFLCTTRKLVSVSMLILSR